MDSVLTWLSHYGYAGLFAMLMFGIAGLPIPDETLLMCSGYLIWAGRLDALLTFGTAAAGSISGISLSYAVGRTVGHSVILRYGRHFHVTQQNIDRAHEWFRHLGNWLLTFGYFIPGVRHFTALTAGMSELEYPIFAAFAYSGAVIWVTTFLGIGYVVGENWRSATVLLHRYTLVAAVLALIILVVAWCWRRHWRKRSNS